LAVKRQAKANADAKATVAGQANAEVVAYKTGWSHHAVAACGDGRIDTEYGEECEPPNPGAGCSNACGLE
jgi:hypothetical protein